MRFVSTLLGSALFQKEMELLTAQGRFMRRFGWSAIFALLLFAGDPVQAQSKARSKARAPTPLPAQAPTPVQAPAQDPGGFADFLLFDNTTKELQGTGKESNLVFQFSFTNAAPGQVVIESVRTSCGCTVARVPTLPWTIPPGGDGEFSVALDTRGKRGTITKSVFLNTSMGVKPLTVRARLPETPPGSGSDDRLRNMQIAQADRFAVFRGECASCHVKPAEGKFGVALYLGACAVCHDSQNRASMVPDLKRLPHPTDRDYWIRWVTFGRHGSFMPAFSQSEGGPLTEAQIDSLADYLTQAISQRRLAQTSPVTASAVGPSNVRTIEPVARPSTVRTTILPSKVALPPLPVAPAPQPAGVDHPSEGK